VSSPEDRGVAKWTGTPEEALRMVRAAGHFYGIERIGVMEVTANTKKLWSPRVKWENISEADPDDSYTVPAKAKYGMVIMVRQPLEMTKRGPSPQNVGATYGYMYYNILKERMQRFVKSLGYMALDRDVNSCNVASGALTGNGELSRISHLYHYSWGTAMRYNPIVLTDLPLQPTKPIDAGMFRFCSTCKICGETCFDVNGLSPISTETDPTYDITGPWNRTGVKSYQFTWPYDYFCNYCQASCPWTNHGMSMAHDVVKAVAATTGVFNAFFTQMEHTFGYSRHWEDTDRLGDWWDRDLNNDKFDVIWK
jgi:reductive dehalogenase